MGSLGPLQAGELAQVVPGRQIVQPPPSSEAFAAEAVQGAESKTFILKTIDERFRSAAGSASATLEALPAAEAEIPPFNPAAARVSGSLLHVDLGASLQVQGTLQNNVGVSDGKFTLETGLSIGVLDSSGTVRPLRHGQVSFADQYQFLDSQSKQVNLVKNSGLVDVPLEPDEVSLVGNNPLAVAVGSATVLQEPPSGYRLGIETFSARLVPGASSTLRLMARKFGRPVVGAQPATWQIYNASTGQPSNEIAIAWGGSTDANGLATLTVSTPGGDVTLPPARRPLDSQVYFVFFFDPDGQLLGDGYGETPSGNNVTFTVLRFQSYTAPAEPAWQQDVGPVLQAYARLYPGMKERLDIGDEATVRSFAPALYGRMSLPVQDPAYMPVTRDLSPAKVKMILQWLKAQQGS